MDGAMQLATSVLSSVAVSAGLTAALVFLAREWISERLSNAIRHEYDQKLEAFKDTIRARQEIRDAANTNFAATHQAAFDRRLDAIAAIWKHATQLRCITPAVLQVIDHLDEARYKHFLRDNRDNNTLRSQIGHSVIANTIGPIVTEASEVRPFVGEYLYALFDA